MSKILSQEEMDALLHHQNQVNESSGVNGGEKNYVKYDFRKKRKFLLDFNDLNYYANKFAEEIKGILSSFFVKNIKVKLKGVKSMMLKEVKEMLQFPAGIGYCKLREGDKNFLAVVDDTAAFAFIELFFGGISISEKKFETRSFTIIEQRVIKKIFKEVIHGLRDKFLDFFKCEGVFETLEMIPAHINIWEDKQQLVIFEMEVSMDDFGGSMFFLEDIAGRIFLIFPLDFFQCKNNKDDKDLHTVKSQDNGNIRLYNSLLDILIPVNVVLGELELTLSEVYCLKNNDVLLLDKKIDHELDILIEGKPKFKGIHGISKGLHAIKITKKL